jgi:hypoxanthine phosphoribosyltransferase
MYNNHGIKFAADTITLDNLSPDEVIIVEDVVDTGKTIMRYKGYEVVSLVKKPWAPPILFAALETKDWVQFPWENE